MTKSSATHQLLDTLGQVITYSITATNSGNVALSGVSVSDTNATLGSCEPNLPVESLAPGASVTCSATHTVTQSDLNAANITNVAHATGNPPGEGAPVTGTSNTLVIDSVQSPALSLDKTADTAEPLRRRRQRWSPTSYLATNTGNVTLDPVQASPDHPGRDMATGLLSQSPTGARPPACSATWSCESLPP